MLCCVAMSYWPGSSVVRAASLHELGHADLLSKSRATTGRPQDVHSVERTTTFQTRPPVHRLQESGSPFEHCRDLGMSASAQCLLRSAQPGDCQHYLRLIAPILFDSSLTVLTATRRQLTRVRDDVTAIGFEAGCVGDKIRFIIYNKL